MQKINSLPIQYTNVLFCLIIYIMLNRLFKPFIYGRCVAPTLLHHHTKDLHKKVCKCIYIAHQCTYICTYVHALKHVYIYIVTLVRRLLSYLCFRFGDGEGDVYKA